MLQSLRDKTSGWIATLILGLLIIPFAFVGVNEYATGGSDSAVAKVQAPPTWWSSAPSWWPASMLWQHEDVTQEEFRAAFEQARQQQREALGENFDPRAFETQENKLLVLEQLIDQRVLKLTSRQAGVVISDAAVREAIASEPAFQVDGKFDANRYSLLLSSQIPALTPLEFERQRDGDQRDQQREGQMAHAILRRLKRDRSRDPESRWRHLRSGRRRAQGGCRFRGRQRNPSCWTCGAP